MQFIKDWLEVLGFLLGIALFGLAITWIFWGPGFLKWLFHLNAIN